MSGISKYRLGLLLGLVIFFSLAVQISEAKRNRKNRKNKVSSTISPLVYNTTEYYDADNVTEEYSEAVTKSRQQDNFYFDPSPLGGEVVEGDQMRLRCDVSNRKHIAFYWTLDDRKVVNTSRRFQEDSDLRIMRVDRGMDSGSFRCIATNVTNGMSIRSIEAKLSILWIDKVASVQLKNKEDVAEGVDLTLKCQVDGNPEPIVEWYKNKIRLFENEHVRIHKTRLKVTSVTAEDNGVYSCKAKNLGGEVESSENYILNIEGGEAAHLDLASFRARQLVRRGDPAELHCLFTNALITEWYDKNQRRLKSGDKYTQHSNGTLVLHEVSASDEGSYKCVGISETGPVQAFTSELQLAYLEPFTEANFEPQPPKSYPKVIPINQKYELQCFAPEGIPKPQIRWTDPAGAQLTEAGRTRATENTLSINNAQPEDSGNYSCVAWNLAGEQRQDVWVVVSVPPEIKTPPLSERIQEGETAQFSCRMEGTPHPVTVISWRKEDVPIDTTHPRFKVNEATGMLRIEDVHLADEGNYACVVNTTGHPLRVSTNAHLYVKKKLKFRPTPVNTKLELDSEAKIHCRAEGQSDPDVTWIKENEPMFPDHIVNIEGTLLFNNVQRSDAGNYTCIATSDQGTIMATINVGVVVKPKFKVRPQNVTAYEGFPVMIHCVAIGDPVPTIQWDKNSKVNSFDLNRFKVMSNGSLYISEAYMEDIGRYGCTAGNSGGFQREEIHLDVRSAENYYRDQHGGLANAESFNMMKTIIIAVCSAVAYLAIVIGLTVYCSIRLLKAKQRKANENGSATRSDKTENGTVPTEHTELMDKKDRDSSVVKVLMSDDARSHVSGVSSHHSHSSNSHHGSHASRARNYDMLSFPRHELQTLGMLGKGHYGDVFLAKAHNIRDTEPETLVVVKSILTRDERMHFEFRREMEIFSKCIHENVVRLLGLCREMEPQFLISEYCEWGDLKQFLWATRKDNGKRNVKLPPLTLAQKVTMCQQVALGMEHIANHRFVHRDLASRNILLSSTLDLKISNLALCRDVYASEYYFFHNSLIPLRWMAPETVLEDDFSTKSDVWSFGCFVYEVFSLGDLPHKSMADDEVLKGLKMVNLLQLDAPVGCPPEMWDLVCRCMREGPKERPSFSEICIAISEMTVDSDV